MWQCSRAITSGRQDWWLLGGWWDGSPVCGSPPYASSWFPYLLPSRTLYMPSGRGRSLISWCLYFCSVAQSFLTLWLHWLQHTCPLSSRVCSNSCPLSWSCYPTILSSVSPSPSFPASGSFPMSQIFASGGRSIGASVSASVLPMNIPGWFPLGLTGLISLLSKGL